MKMFIAFGVNAGFIVGYGNEAEDSALLCRFGCCDGGNHFGVTLDGDLVVIWRPEEFADNHFGDWGIINSPNDVAPEVISAMERGLSLKAGTLTAEALLPCVQTLARGYVAGFAVMFTQINVELSPDEIGAAVAEGIRRAHVSVTPEGL